MRIEPTNDDPIRQYSTFETVKLDQNLDELAEQVRGIDSKNQEYSIRLICGWHARLFDGVRDHAGRYRSSDFGEDRLKFGPNYSVPREDVLNELDVHQRRAKGMLDQLERMERSGQGHATEFVEQVLKAALWVHADLIRIHPFRDGNGRTGRLIITYFLRRWGFPAFPMEIPKQEYFDCLNRYYATREFDPLVNLAFRLYRNMLAVE